ncbi:hypothetical protein O3M35_007412 [Rhynocoris fuscipes]|uniref:Ribosomal protein L7Ae/L30e/S12e/Gadd45 domain-containing protein n=1 Tax=Rhynocoris fuscipes TaxID=488301 RepID=A0AAW1DEM1_9HEMI
MALSQNKTSRKKQKNLRNVLGLNEKTFWPVVSESECLALNTKLKSCLKDVRINIPRASWFAIRSLSKEERKKANEELLKSQTLEQIEAYHYALKLRQFLFIGVNSLCLGIEKNQVAACLLDGDVNPKILVKHVIELTNNSKVPVSTVPNLKGTLKSIVGFSSMAIGFHKDVLEDKTHIFHDLCSYIIEIAKSNENTNKDLREDIKISTKYQTVPDKTITEQPPAPSDIPSLLKNIYLQRESEDIRVFKPPSNDNSTSSLVIDEQMPEDVNIKLPTTFDDLFEEVSTTRYFKPLVVNRIQSNPKKKKINLKKKKFKA